MIEFIEQLINTLETGSGVWNPLIWIIAFVIIFLLVYIIRGFGNKSYKKGTEQTKVFLSGNKEYESKDMHVKAKNLYWGFSESLKLLYKYFDKMHNGNTGDYVLWFVIILGVLFLIFGVI